MQSRVVAPGSLHCPLINGTCKKEECPFWFVSSEIRNVWIKETLSAVPRKHIDRERIYGCGLSFLVVNMMLKTRGIKDEKVDYESMFVGQFGYYGLSNHWKNNASQAGTAGPS